MANSNVGSDFFIEYEFFYPYNELNMLEHIDIIGGNKSKNLLDKLKTFSFGDLILSSELNFSRYKKGEVDFSDFFIEKSFGVGSIGPISENLYSDSPYVYLLGKGKEYGAILSIEPRPNALMVTQIQGLKDKRNVWGKLRYADFLLDIAEKDFEGLGISEMFVLPYFKNKWGSVRENKNNTKIRQYDIPARRQNFEFDETRQIWYKELL